MSRRGTLFPTEPIDPGYGDPSAPAGSEDWAKRWRLSFQSIATGLRFDPELARSLLDDGLKHRAWTLITDKAGVHFKTFDAFCECPKPYGLGLPYPEFRGYLEARYGKAAIDLLIVPPEGQPGRPSSENPPHRAEDFGSGTPDKQTRLRAILRAPEPIQDLYRRGLVSQTTAALMGPRKPDEDQAARVVRARDVVAAIPRPEDESGKALREYRRAVDAAIRAVMGRPQLSPLQQACHIVRRLTPEDRLRLVQWLDAGCPDAT